MGAGHHMGENYRARRRKELQFRRGLVVLPSKGLQSQHTQKSQDYSTGFRAEKGALARRGGKGEGGGRRGYKGDKW